MVEVVHPSQGGVVEDDAPDAAVLGQGVDVEAVHHALHLGLDPAVAVQGPVHAAEHQRFVVHPGHGGGQLALAFGGDHGVVLGGQNPVAA